MEDSEGVRIGRLESRVHEGGMCVCACATVQHLGCFSYLGRVYRPEYHDMAIYIHPLKLAGRQLLCAALVVSASLV